MHGEAKAQIHRAIYFLWKISQWELSSFRPLNTCFVDWGCAYWPQVTESQWKIRNFNTSPVPPLITHCVSLASSNPVPDRVQAVIRSDRRDLDTSTNKQLRKQIFKRKGFLPSADWFLLKVLILFNIFCSSPEMHCRALSAFCFGQVFTERQQFGCFLQKKWLQVQSRQPGIR